MFLGDFLYKGKKIELWDYNICPIGSFFKNEINPIIIVNDINNIIGQKIKINFETNLGYKHEIIIHNKKTIFELLESYLGEV